jgi:two-component system sensor histidine kinase KdpD
MSELDDAVALVVARLAHDLKNPLAVILSNLRYLRMSIREPEDNEAIQESLVSADRLDRALNDLVDLNRLREVGLGAVAAASVAELAPVLRDKLELQIGRRTFDVQLPQIKLRTDHGLLGRVLLNVLEPAFRNTPSTGTVYLRGAKEGDAFVLEVVDGGAPFAPDRDPSFLVDDVTVRAAPPRGCRSDQGLGLHFAGVASRALGARTEVRARDAAAGLVFRLIFPADLLP